jgi:hypothetical protein
MSHVSAPSAVAELRLSLDAVAAALVAADADALHAAQPRLSSALAAVRRVQAVPGDQHAALRADLAQCRLLLDRCRRLGAVATELSASALLATGVSVGYGRIGQTATSGLRGSHLKERR